MQLHLKNLGMLIICLLLVLAGMTCAAAQTEISLWTYPIGGWTDEQTVDEIIAGFNAVWPEIRVSIRCLDYGTGDHIVEEALENGTAPDIIMEGPERLVANWGSSGHMLDLSDLWEDTRFDIMASSMAVEPACRNADGKYYVYPLCMTAHCMAINYNDFKAADALQYIDELTHTWTTDGFVNAVRALKAAGFAPGVLYCGGQGGDQGTRALVTNLYSGVFTDSEHTRYTLNNDENIRALTLLKTMVSEGLLTADPEIAGGDAISLFCDGENSMTFCWNASAAITNKLTMAKDVTVFSMAFPSEDGYPELQGGIWGFGVFDNGDAARAEAAKTFIRFVCDDPGQAASSVYESGFFPTRASLGDIYSGTEKSDNAEYAIYVPFLGDYYQITQNWTMQRAEWWQLLQRIFGGGDVASEVAVYMDRVNQN